MNRRGEKYYKVEFDRRSYADEVAILIETLKYGKPSRRRIRISKPLLRDGLVPAWLLDRKLAAIGAWGEKVVTKFGKFVYLRPERRTLRVPIFDHVPTADELKKEIGPVTDLATAFQWSLSRWKSKWDNATVWRLKYVGDEGFCAVFNKPCGGLRHEDCPIYNCCAKGEPFYNFRRDPTAATHDAVLHQIEREAGREFEIEYYAAKGDPSWREKVLRVPVFDHVPDHQELKAEIGEVNNVQKAYRWALSKWKSEPTEETEGRLGRYSTCRSCAYWNCKHIPRAIAKDKECPLVSCVAPDAGFLYFSETLEPGARVAILLEIERAAKKRGYLVEYYRA